MNDLWKPLALVSASSGIMALLVTVAIHAGIRDQFAILWLAFTLYTFLIMALIISGREL